MGPVGTCQPPGPEESDGCHLWHSGSPVTTWLLKLLQLKQQAPPRIHLHLLTAQPEHSPHHSTLTAVQIHCRSLPEGNCFSCCSWHCHRLFQPDHYSPRLLLSLQPLSMTALGAFATQCLGPCSRAMDWDYAGRS